MGDALGWDSPLHRPEGGPAAFGWYGLIGQLFSQVSAPTRDDGPSAQGPPFALFRLLLCIMSRGPTFDRPTVPPLSGLDLRPYEDPRSERPGCRTCLQPGGPSPLPPGGLDPRLRRPPGLLPRVRRMPVQRAAALRGGEPRPRQLPSAGRAGHRRADRPRPEPDRHWPGRQPPLQGRRSASILGNGDARAVDPADASPALAAPAPRLRHRHPGDPRPAERDP